MNIYYVYVYFRPNGTPCYIGKGHDNRWLHHERLRDKHSNKHLARIIAKAGGSLPKVKIRSGLTEPDAFAAEIAFIAAIGRADLGKGPLVNLTNGGEGVSGLICSEANKEAARVRATGNTNRRGKKDSAITRENMSIAHRGKRQTQLTKDKRAAANRGQKRDASFLQKLRARKGEKRSAAACENMRQAALGKILTDNHRQSISKSTKLALADPIIRQKLRDAVKASWARRKANKQDGDSQHNRR